MQKKLKADAISHLNNRYLCNLNTKFEYEN